MNICIDFYKHHVTITPYHVFLNMICLSNDAYGNSLYISSDAVSYKMCQAEQDRAGNEPAGATTPWIHRPSIDMYHNPTLNNR